VVGVAMGIFHDADEMEEGRGETPLEPPRPYSCESADDEEGEWRGRKRRPEKK
jgi:hypothetical protein